MSEFSRRNFLKAVTLAGTAAAAGCSSESARTLIPYIIPPENIVPGEATWYATTCRECPAGCGLVVRTMQGRALKVEGNPNNPINLGKTCSRGQASVQGLYNPDRPKHPFKQSRGGGNPTEMSWDAAVSTIKNALTTHKGSEVAFLLGFADTSAFSRAFKRWTGKSPRDFAQRS